MWSGGGGRAIEKVVGQEVLDKRDRKKEKVKTNCQGLASQVTPSPLPLSEIKITCLQPKSSSWLCDSQLTNENCTPTTYFPSKAEKEGGRRTLAWRHHPWSPGRDKMITPSIAPFLAASPTTASAPARPGGPVKLAGGRQMGEIDIMTQS